jgi:hypothetical protein
MMGHPVVAFGCLICIAQNDSKNSSVVPMGDRSSSTIFWFSIFILT